MSRRAIRWLAACGIVIPALDALVTVSLGALDPGYSHTRQYISELGETGRPYAAAFNAWCVVYGLLMVCFAVAAGRGLDSRPVLVALLAVAVASVVGGIFPCDSGCAGQSPTAQVHVLTGYVGLAGMILTPFLALREMRRQTAWRGYGALTLASGVLLVATIGWLGACHYLGGRHDVRCPVGLIQRLILGIQYAWMMVVAVKLLRPAGES